MVIVLGTQSLEAASVVVSQIVTGGAIGTAGGCATVSTQAKCTVRSLDPGGTILMTVQGYVNGAAGSFIIGTATVTGNIKNKGVTSTDTEPTTVKPFVDLTITKSDAPDPVCARSWPTPAPPPGAVCLGGLTYTYVVGNSGIGAASNVLVRDPLPAGTIFDHSTPAICSVNGSNVLTCNIASLAAQTTTTIVVVLVAPPGIGTISNTVTVDPNNTIFEGDETNNTATATTLVGTGIDLIVAKTDQFDPIATSGTETYTITVDNIGPQDATGIRVRDTLPAGTIFRDVIQQTNGFTCSYSSGNLECVGGSIRGTESEFVGPPPLGPDIATIKFRVFAQSFEGTMHNEVRVDPNGEIPEINEGNNFAFQNTVVNSGGATEGAFNELTIVKTQTSPANPVARNALVTYSIVIGNDGTDPAVNVSVRDFPPANARYIEATGTNGFHCTEVGNVVNCGGGTVPAAGSVTLTLKIFAPDTPGDYTNQAIVDPDFKIPEGNEFNNESSVPTVVADGGNGAFNDLQIMKTSTDTTPGGPIDYTIKVWNTGSNPALNVTVRDVLPAGVTFVSATDGAVLAGRSRAARPAGRQPLRRDHQRQHDDCHRRPSISRRRRRTRTRRCTTRRLSIRKHDPEGSELNNTAVADTQVKSVVNLSITKTGPPTSNQSQPGQYVITVKNEKSGTGAPVDNVHVHDPLPVGLIPLAIEIDPGDENTWACQITQNAINVVDCFGHLDPDQSVTFKIDVFMTAESGKSLDNEACVDPENLIEEFNPPGETDNCSTHTTVIVPRSPNLFLTKAADPGLVTPGGDLTYTIGIQNVGNAAADGPLTITDTLPNVAGVASVTFVDATGTDGWTCSYAGGISVICHDGPAPGGGNGLAAGASANITMHVTVHTDVTVPLVNTATAAPALTSEAGAISEAAAGHTADNTATVTTSVGGSGFDLVLSALSDNPDPVAPGQPLQYTMVGVNGGTADAPEDRHQHPFRRVLFQNADGSNGFNCVGPTSSVVTCEGPLPAGGDTTIKVSFTVLLD